MSDYDKIKEQVEERLQKQQANKEFKDIGRVANSRKEKSAFKIVSSKLLSNLELDGVMAYNMVKKENVWKEIDVNAEREKGVTSGGAYLKVKIRESLPTRPKDSPSARQSYVAFTEFLQTSLAQCYNVEDIRKFSDKVYSRLSLSEFLIAFINPDFNLLSDDEKIEFQEKIKRSNYNLSQIIASTYGTSIVTGSDYFNEAKTVSAYYVKKIIKEIFGAKFLNLFFKGSDSATQTWSEAIDKEPISKEESDEKIMKLKESLERNDIQDKKKAEDYQVMDDSQLRKSFSEWQMSSHWVAIYRNDLEKYRDFAIDFYKKRIEKRKVSIEESIKKYQPRENDWSWFDGEKTSKQESTKPKSKAINTKTPLDYIKRIGGYKIEANTPQEIIEKFGFSAVNYGVYVDDKWSKEHTKNFLGAMSDLGEILNIDLKQINQLGKLGISFGAKGRAGHLATYFPQTKDINLTKGNGDGSVAHEWGHYFDNVIVERDIQRATNGFASSGQSKNTLIHLAFNKLMDFIKRGDSEHTPKVPFRFYPKPSQTPVDYYSRRYGNQKVEIKSTIEETLEQYEEICVANQSYYYTQLRVLGYIISQFNLPYYDVPMKIPTSYYYHKSRYNLFEYCYVNETKKTTEIVASTRTKYWTEDVELFARAWETVMLKKLMDKNRESTYLVADIPLDDIVSENYYSPYPTGKELEHIEKLIDEIVSVVKSELSINDFVPPSDVREDEYIDLTNDKKAKTETAIKIENPNKEEEKVVFIDKDKEVKEVEVQKDNLDELEYLQSKLTATEILLKFKRNSGTKEEIEYLESKINVTKTLIKFKSKK